MRRLIQACAMGLALCAATHAQYTAGTTVFTDQMGLSWFGLYAIQAGGRLTTVARMPVWARAMMPSPDNRGLWVNGKSNRGLIVINVAPDGTITNVTSGVQASAMDVDEAGAAILSDGIGPRVLRYANNTLSTIINQWALGSVEGGAFDLQSGDYIFRDGHFLQPTLFRLKTWGTPRLTTITSLPMPPGQLGGLHSDPETGHMLCTYVRDLGSSNISEIYALRLGAPARLTTLYSGLPLVGPWAIDRDPADGQFVVCSEGNPFQPAGVFKFDARNAAITTLTLLPSRIAPLSVTVAGSRHLSGRTVPQPGRPYQLLVSSPAERGALYVVALSLGVRPGIPVGSARKIHLALDALFVYSLSNAGIFSGFQGRLDANGEAVATVTLPNLPGLSGTRFFAAAVTLAPHGIGVISDPLGVTIR